MKVLYVSGGDDYMALTFEQDHVKDGDYKTWFDKTVENGGNMWIEDDYIELTAHEFGEVDKKFIDFVRHEIQDYDDSKHSNFYVVEE